MIKIDTSPEKIDKILDRGVIVDILPSKKEFRSKLLSGDRIKIYIGIDPTSTSLHLSHAKNIMVLEELRSLGHEIVIVMGNFTAKIGDPTNMVKGARKQLSDKDIEKNVKSMLTQIKPIMGLGDKNNPPRIAYNGDWLSKLSFEDVIDLASNFTVQQMLERDMFKKRIQEGRPVFLHEFFYPLMQGYDSVALDTDAEMGGTDQVFNMLAGRTLLKRIKNKEKFVVVVNLMENPKTGDLMSKSKGNGVFLDSSPDKMFGEVMAQPDEMLEILFINTTRVPLGEIKELMKETSNGGKAVKEVKMRLAEEIVKIYHSEKDAKGARENFIKVFSENKKPKKIERYTHTKKEDTVVNLLQVSGMAESMTASRRLILDKAVELDGEVVLDPKKLVDLSRVRFFKVGKHRFKEMDS